MILWFSGTGNSRVVAERLAAGLSQQLRELTPDITASRFALLDGESSIIWVCPVYSWGIPPYVRSIMKNIDISAGGKPLTHHLVLTCGDDCGLASDMWRKDMSARGWTAGNAYSVIMPNNYVCMKGFNVDPVELAERKLAEAPARIDAVAAGIRAYKPGDTPADDIVRGSFAWIKTRVIYPWFVRNAMSPKPFRYTKDCISCGKCAAACPLGNVTMQSGAPDSSGRSRRRPSWGPSCAGCLACYHVCPRHAVMYGKSTVGKGQYMNPLV